MIAVNFATLHPSGDASRPDPAIGYGPAFDSRGRIYSMATSATGRGTIVVWDGAGNYLRSIGGSGDGPGEFRTNGLQPFIGVDDSVYVFEQGRWAVFDSSLTFVRQYPSAPVIPVTTQSLHLLPHGRVLSTWPIGRPVPEGTMLVIGTDGTVESSFGAAAGVGPVDPGEHIGLRPSGYHFGDSTFWVAPPIGSDGDYELEEWTLSGRFVRSLRRKVEWFPRERNPHPLNLPLITWLSVDPQGRLWVYLKVPDHRVPPPLPEEVGSIEDWSSVGDVRLEVIDPEGPAVLASAWIDDFPDDFGWTETLPIQILLAGAPRGARRVKDDVDFVSVELYDLHLVQRR